MCGSNYKYVHTLFLFGRFESISVPLPITVSLSILHTRMLTKNQEAAIKHGAKGGTGGGYRIGVMHVGAPACGMNAAARSFIRNAISTGHRAFGINNSLEVNICSVHAPVKLICPSMLFVEIGNGDIF